ncbi:MAG: histidine ammonia-lyase [Candidatus Thorarchaeota archaeon]|nr:MAG: histidine ammonia-lyase [Candidatus Thorarchaeota archaeon]
MTVTIDGESLTIEDVVRVARHGEDVTLTDDARMKIEKSRQVIEAAIREGRTVYGVNTGFGDLANVSIAASDVADLQVNLIRSHSVGVGEPFPEEVVRGMMLLRANALAKGFSGVRLEVVETLLRMLNRGVTPVVPQQGSVGSSGDLAPLAHMVLVMIGEGEAFLEGKRMDGAEAMRRADIPLVVLQAKEGVALINGTQPMTAVGVLAIHDALRLVSDATVAGAMSLEALRGTRAAYDARIHAVRPHEGQVDAARALLSILADSEINRSHADCGKVQDAYSLRCFPQVLGASIDAIRYVSSVLEVEINAATDNPLVFPDDGTVVSGGNFHGQPVALAMDFLSIALSEIANIAERRINRLVDPKLSGLPPFLTRNSGLQSGMMIAQYTAASLVSENKVLAHPASVDSIPTSAEQEDHVSMGTIAARKARQILENVKNVVAIEYLCAAQGLDLLAPLRPSEALERAHALIRTVVPELTDDRPLYSDIVKIRQLMDCGEIVSAVESVTGALYEV